MANEFKIKKGLIVTGASGGTVVDIQGSQGQLFSVTDDLSGSIFAVSDISGVPILDVNSSGAVNIDGTLIGSSTAYFSGAITTNLSSEGTYFTGGSGGIRQLSITSGTNTSAHALHTFNIASSNGKYEFDVNGTTELSLDSSNATFAGFISTPSYVYAGGAVRVPYAIASKMPMIVLNGATNYGLFHTEGSPDIFSFDFSGSSKQSFNELGDATFVGQGFSAATSSGDASSTLTTKGYVDGLITGATIYRGAWDPSGGGYGSPDLSGVTQTSGYYYICSAAGTAEPNGTGTEPDTWAVGDWVIYNDVSGTGQWQKIDNSSVLSGVGTGQTVALWEGAGSVTDSETLGNAPITVSGNDTTFAGTGTFAGNVALGGTGQYTTNQSLNIDGTGLAIKNNVNGSSNNWSYIHNTATASSSNLVFATGGALTALTLEHSGAATFAGTLQVSGNNIGVGGAASNPTYGTITQKIDMNGNADSMIIMRGSVASTEYALYAYNGDFMITQTNVNNWWTAPDFKLNSGNATFAGNVTAGSNAVQNGANPGLKVTSSNTSQTVLSLNNTTTRNYELAVGGSASGIDPGSFYIYDGTAAAARLIINTSGNVGIGTTSPNRLLHLSANDNTGATIYPLNIQRKYAVTSANPRGTGIQFSDLSSQQALITAFRENSAVNHKSYLTFSTNNGANGADMIERMRITSAGALEIQGAATPNGFRDAVITNTDTLTTIASTQTGAYSKDMAFNTGSERMRIKSGGNVGIGTTTPSAKLEVNVGVNSLKISGRDTYIDSSIDSANANIYVTQAGAGDFGQLAGSLVLQARTQGTVYRDIIFAGGLTSGDALMTIQGEGNVGIGTTNINFSNGNGLVIGSSGAARLKIANSSTGYGATNGFEIIQSGLNSYVYNYEAGPMYFGTSSSTRMTILSGGNVGIGTTSPGAKLHIYGTGSSINSQTDIMAIIQNSTYGSGDTAGENKLIFGWNNHYAAAISAYKDGAVNRTGLKFYTEVGYNVPVERIRITSAGALEIQGTATPSANKNAFITNSDTLTLIGSTQSAGTPKDMAFYTGQEAMRIEADGTVLIGTASSAYNTTQGYPLHAMSDLTSQSYISVARKGQTSGSAGLVVGLDTTNAYLLVRDNIPLVLGTNNLSHVFIQPSGNVGIGTTLPKAKLDVNGHFCVDSKAHTITNAFTTCLTVNLTNHTGCHVVITVFGDWPGHSSAAYRGEFFLQNGANAYAEPGIILRQDDNTSVGTDQIICQIVDPSSTANPKDFAVQIRHTDTTSPASWTGQLTYTVQGKFNSIT